MLRARGSAEYMPAIGQKEARKRARERQKVRTTCLARVQILNLPSLGSTSLSATAFSNSFASTSNFSATCSHVIPSSIPGPPSACPTNPIMVRSSCAPPAFRGGNRLEGRAGWVAPSGTSFSGRCELDRIGPCVGALRPK
jgi:hypothetical protein